MKKTKLEKLQELEKIDLIIMNIMLGYGGCLINQGYYKKAILFIVLWIIGVVILFILSHKQVDEKYKKGNKNDKRRSS